MTNTPGDDARPRADRGPGPAGGGPGHIAGYQAGRHAGEKHFTFGIRGSRPEWPAEIPWAASAGLRAMFGLTGYPAANPRITAERVAARDYPLTGPVAHPVADPLLGDLPPVLDEATMYSFTRAWRAAQRAQDTPDLGGRPGVVEQENLPQPVTYDQGVEVVYDPGTESWAEFDQGHDAIDTVTRSDLAAGPGPGAAYGYVAGARQLVGPGSVPDDPPPPMGSPGRDKPGHEHGFWDHRWGIRADGDEADDDSDEHDDDRDDDPVSVVSRHLPAGAPAAGELAALVGRLRPGAILHVVGADGQLLAKIPVPSKRKSGRHGRGWRAKRDRRLRQARERASQSADRDQAARGRSARQAADETDTMGTQARREQNQPKEQGPQARDARAEIAETVRSAWSAPQTADQIQAARTYEAVLWRRLSDAEPWTMHTPGAPGLTIQSQAPLADDRPEVRFDWASDLHGDELRLFVESLADLIQQMRATTVKGEEVSYSAFNALCQGWQRTAEIWRNRELLRRVLQPSARGDFGPVRRPQPG
jgi:hypothetical protein